ncbi:peptidoglycan/LPS O-acetylase OafA/YrhL [Nocardioides ginsengisegetis]|uniref:Peptidoglycan/LPS O-acetylase OafA/YrhL n=1 Tax=Nocardioides ginsengisegetis TaxID=661491 RepID=A0A7W3J3F1_9ACTN|nr:acyltransferase [Nocardioides ginsengisegetis]MBA8805553.1 peptidoglycan/LPS O-acetylase OafA/YrhL [Nocardioides ginsengisegetis]
MTVTQLHPRRPEPTEAQPAPARPVYPLGWLRGLAALFVVFFHAYQNNRTGPTYVWPWSGTAHQLMLGTDLFVDMFFVLSGLVLWLPVARAAAEGREGRPGRVLLYRRLARLVPLYFTIVLIVWGLTNPVWPGHWQDLLTHLTFTHVYTDTYIFWTDGPAWSLAVEFHFYVLMALAVPFVNRAVRRTTSRAGRLAVVSVLPVLAAVVGLGDLLWSIVLTDQDPTNWSVWFSPLSRGADFGIGMGLAVLAAAGVRLGRPARIAAVVVGLAATGVLVMTRPFDSNATEWWHPLYALTLAVAMSAIVLHDGPWPRVLDWKPLAWVGGLGYGVYLLHEPVMRLVGWMGLLPAARPGAWFIITFAIVIGPSLALAWLSSRTVEAAGLRMLSMIDKDGRPRDYYAHLTPDALEQDDSEEPARA